MDYGCFFDLAFLYLFMCSFSSSGILVTDWGDFGHLQCPFVSLPGFLAGAEASWSSPGQVFQKNVPRKVEELSCDFERRLSSLLDIYCFHPSSGKLPNGCSLGQICLELGILIAICFVTFLGNFSQLCSRNLPNSTLIFWGLLLTGPLTATRLAERALKLM